MNLKAILLVLFIALAACKKNEDSTSQDVPPTDLTDLTFKIEAQSSLGKIEDLKKSEIPIDSPNFLKLSKLQNLLSADFGPFIDAGFTVATIYPNIVPKGRITCPLLSEMFKPLALQIARRENHFISNEAGTVGATSQMTLKADSWIDEKGQSIRLRAVGRTSFLICLKFGTKLPVSDREVFELTFDGNEWRFWDEPVVNVYYDLNHD